MVIRFSDSTVKDGHIVATAAVTNANSFTTACEFNPTKPFNVSVEGTFSATVALQRSFDNGVTWLNVWTTTSPAEMLCLTQEEGILWQLGVPTGNFSSGTVNVRISQ